MNFSCKAMMGMLLSLSMLLPLIAKKDENAVLDSINQKVSKINKTLFPSSTSAATLLVANHNKNAVLDSINQKVSKINKSLIPPTYDYIIVGLGTSGGVLARFLSDAHSPFTNRVLALEAGDNYTTDPIVTQGFLTGATGWQLEFNQKYSLTTPVPDPTNFPDGGGQELFSSGRGWGGSSTHNFLLTVRGTADIYNQWATISGDNRWTYANLLPYMKFLETFTPTAGAPAPTAERGTTGALQINQNSLVTNPAALTFFNTIAVAMNGSNYTDTGTDYNISTQPLGVYDEQSFVDQSGHRSSSVTAFLSPTSIVSSNGQGIGGRLLTIQSGAVVNKVLFDGNTAIGVEYVQNGVTKQAFAAKQVILSAGAPHSAAILERSGIGDPAVLNAAGVPVLVANTNVGVGLRNTIGALAIMTTPTSLPPIAGNLSFPPSVSFGDGSTVPGFGMTAGQRNIELLVYPPEANTFVDPTIVTALQLTSTRYITAFGWNLRQKAVGTSHILDNNPFTYPNMDFGFYTDTGSLSNPPTPGSDMAVSQAILAMIKNIAHSNGQTLLYPPDASISTTAPQTSETPIVQSELVMLPVVPNHYTGTTNMGTSIANSVVSGSLAVWGVNKLMVADSSIVPLPETGNTAWEAYVIGLVAANILGQFSLS